MRAVERWCQCCGRGADRINGATHEWGHCGWCERQWKTNSVLTPTMIAASGRAICDPPINGYRVVERRDDEVRPPILYGVDYYMRRALGSSSWISACSVRP
jgi:hypothetical protein